MKLAELIEEITLIRGQEYDTETMTGWVNELEGQAEELVFSREQGYGGSFQPYAYDEDAEKELLVPDRFRDVYINYMLSKIDFYNQEAERYNNDVMMFDASWKAFEGWFIRTHDMKPLPKFRKH